MMPRIALPVVCKHFRWTPKKYGCEKHGTCAHTAKWMACDDFLPGQRKGAPIAPPVATPAPRLPCVHQGAATGKSVVCETCNRGNGTRLNTFACGVHGACTIDPSRSAVSVQSCGTCEQHEPRPPAPARIITDSPPVDMTFVWIYWHGGAKADELRWSIRSVLKNYHGKASILVVGDPPPWYSGPAIRLPRAGPCRMRRYRDQLDKFRAVCVSDLVPESFVWMMDDTVFTARVTIEDIGRPFCWGRVPAIVRGSGEWLDHKRETFAILAKRGLPQVDFCTHMPHVLEKSKFMATWAAFDLGKQTLQWELLYGAMHWPTPERIDGKVFRCIGKTPTIPPAAIINHTAKGWTPGLQAFLKNRFPEPCPFEAAKLKPLRVEPRMRAGLLAFIAALPAGPLTMAEVGSYAGESAEIFAASGKFAVIHCVDSWATFAGKSFPTAEAEPQFDTVAAKFPSVIRKRKTISVDGAKLFADGALDLVYIDAKHDYASVRDDIAAWRPKVRKGGFVCGHDYCLTTPGVIQAVREAFGGETMTIFADDSWMVRV